MEYTFEFSRESTENKAIEKKIKDYLKIKSSPTRDDIYQFCRNRSFDFRIEGTKIFVSTI